MLLELRDVIGARLEESGKAEWAGQEFQHLIDHVPPPRAGPVAAYLRHPQGQGPALPWPPYASSGRCATRSPQQRDTTPGRLIPDSALIAAANAMPTSTAALLDTPGFHGRGARRYADRWLGALERARKLRDTELPPLTIRTDGPPAPRVWAERDPVAAARLATARALVNAFAEEHQVPVENLLTPDYLRRVLWKPPAADRGGHGDRSRRGAGAPGRPALADRDHGADPRPGDPGPEAGEGARADSPQGTA